VSSRNRKYLCDFFAFSEIAKRKYEDFMEKVGYRPNKQLPELARKPKALDAMEFSCSYPKSLSLFEDLRFTYWTGKKKGKSFLYIKHIFLYIIYGTKRKSDFGKTWAES